MPWQPAYYWRRFHSLHLFFPWVWWKGGGASLKAFRFGQQPPGLVLRLLFICLGLTKNTPCGRLATELESWNNLPCSSVLWTLLGGASQTQQSNVSTSCMTECFYFDFVLNDWPTIDRRVASAKEEDKELESESCESPFFATNGGEDEFK